jgi:hypothetical protein
MKHFLLALSSFAATFLHSQYCTSGGPTSTADSQVRSVRIVGQNDSINYTYVCPGILGVQNLTNLSTSLVAGSNYSLSVQFGTCNGNYAGYGEAWIDFDQSGTFDQSESIGTWQGVPPVALTTWNFTVPLMSQNGTTRMRVIQQEGATGLPLDPCAVFQWGSVMDFSINISGGIDCSAYPGDEITDAIPVTVFPYTHVWANSYCYSNQNFVYVSPDVYYLVTPGAQTAHLTASLCGSSFDTYISAIDPQGNVLAYNDDAPSCAPASQITIPCAGQDSIYIIVEGWGNNAGSYTLNITQGIVGVEEIAPAVHSLYPNPADQTFRVSDVTQGLLSITDINGSVVKSVADYQGEPIDISSLPCGFYNVTYSESDRQSIMKLAVTR